MFFKTCQAFSTILIPSVFFLLPNSSTAGCLNQKPICGDSRICVSDRPTAKSGRNDRNSCLPPKVCTALRKLADKYGKVEIASADRSKNNKSRGGAKNSHHMRCNAADFFIPKIVHGGGGSSQKAIQRDLAQFMINNMPNTGKNVYCTGRAHVSISQRENFYKSCVVSKKPRNKRKSRPYRY